MAKNSNQNLCGRDLICSLGIEVNFKKKNSIHFINVDDLLNNFSHDTNKGASNFVAKLSIKEKTKPEIFKCRQVPLTYNVATNKAIDDLVEKGFIEPVQHSDWASPIVSVLKKNKEIRICADF